MDAINQVFDLVVASRHDPEAKEQVNKYVSELLHTEAPSLKQVNNYTTTSDYPKLSEAVAFTVNQVSTSDSGWQMSFQQVPLAGSSSRWAIKTTGGGPVWHLRAEGAPAKVHSTSGEVVYAETECHSTAIGWTREVIDNRDAGVMTDQIVQMTASYSSMLSDKHYGVLLSGAGSTESYASGSTTVEKDIATINNAALNIATKNKDKGYGQLANPQLVMYVHPSLRPRIENAFNPSANLTSEKVVANVVIHYTYFDFGASTTALMVLPGRKIQRAEKPLIELTANDPYRLTDVNIAHKYLGACVADTDQIKKVNFA